MDKRCVVICDSGIGGLRLLKNLERRFPCENFVYFADYKNLPYGEKSKRELFDIAESIYKRAMAFSPKLIVFACNTLSTNVLPSWELKSVPIVGVFPEVAKGKGLLLCTESTAKSEYVLGLKSKNLALDVVAMKGLASQIENAVRFGGEIDLESLDGALFNDYDYVSLGCTHYAYAEKYLRKKFKNKPFISGEKTTFDKIEFFLTTYDTQKCSGGVSIVGSECDFLKTLYNQGIFII